MIDLPLNLDLIERRADAATPGPWVPVDWPIRHPDDPEWEVESHQHELDDPVGVVGHGVEQGRADAEFIASSRTVVPDLVARVRELEAALNEVYEVAGRTGEFQAYQKYPRICGSGRLLAVELFPIINKVMGRKPDGSPGDVDA